jgi:hypothetical protein
LTPNVFQLCPLLGELRVVSLPLRRGADRPRHETAAAVGTDIAQQFFNARCAERALEAADARLE